MKPLPALFLLLLSLQLAAAAPPAPELLKVEPPDWWAGHTINPVRLLIRGRHLRNTSVTASTQDVAVSKVRINPSGTWLFLDLFIQRDAAAGPRSLRLKTPSGSIEIPFVVHPPLDPEKHFQGITTDDVIYLIVTDRFSNGDPDNDAPAGSPPAANRRTDPRAFHGGDFRGVRDRLPYLKDLGVTALWLTPWHDNANSVAECNKPWCPMTDYHGYGAIDYYAVEDHFGSLRALRELVSAAHSLGLKVIQDQVANHVGIDHPWVLDPPLETWFHGSLSQFVLNPFRTDELLSPHATEEARRRNLDGWFSERLPDLNQEEPEVERYLIQNALWWAGTCGIDGIRQDTIQYMPRAFIRSLSDALHRQYPRAWMVGEVLDRDPAHTGFFMGGRAGWDGIDTRLDAVFDFPLWQASHDAFSGKRPMRALRDTLKYDALYPDATRLVVPSGNHDLARFPSLKGATPDGHRMHLAFTLSARGIPQLYYGDEIGLPGKDDPDNRRDFPGGWPGDARNAFEPGDRTDAERVMHAWTRTWCHLRKAWSALRRGSWVDLAFDEDIYVFARRHEDEVVILGFNRAKVSRRVEVVLKEANLRAERGWESLAESDGAWREEGGILVLTLAPQQVTALGSRRGR